MLRQRGALLRQAGGRLGPEIASTLDVWDERLAAAGSDLAVARADLARALGPLVAAAYGALAHRGPSGPGGVGSTPSTEVAIEYRPTWEGPLAEALARARADDVRRAASTVGPHRDDLALVLGGATPGSRPPRASSAAWPWRCASGSTTW